MRRQGWGICFCGDREIPAGRRESERLHFIGEELTPGKPTSALQVHRQADSGLPGSGTLPEEDAWAVVADGAGDWRGDRLRDLYGDRDGDFGEPVQCCRVV